MFGVMFITIINSRINWRLIMISGMSANCLHAHRACILSVAAICLHLVVLIIDHALKILLRVRNTKPVNPASFLVEVKVCIRFIISIAMTRF